MKVDSFDLEILNQLDLDARQSYSQIGKVIRRSKQFVGNRIKTLQEKKILLGYNLDINLRQIGYTIFSLFIQFRGLDKIKEEKIMTYLRNSKNVGFCIKTLGTWDLFISVRAENIADFYNFLESFHKFCTNSIKKESINLEVKGTSTNLKILDKNGKLEKCISKTTGVQEKSELNELETKIFRELKSQPLISYLNLAKKYNKSYETIKNTIRKIKEKKIIKTTRAIIDTEKLGYNRYLFLIELSLSSKNKIEEIQNYLVNHKNIDYVIESLGSWNLICNVYSKDTTELISIIDNLKERFSVIQSIEFLKVIKNEKESFNI